MGLPLVFVPPLRSSWSLSASIVHLAILWVQDFFLHEGFEILIGDVIVSSLISLFLLLFFCCKDFGISMFSDSMLSDFLHFWQVSDLNHSLPQLLSLLQGPRLHAQQC